MTPCVLPSKKTISFVPSLSPNNTHDSFNKCTDKINMMHHLINDFQGAAGVVGAAVNLNHPMQQHQGTSIQPMPLMPQCTQAIPILLLFFSSFSCCFFIFLFFNNKFPNAWFYAFIFYEFPQTSTEN